MSSSAKHSAIFFEVLNAASLAPTVILPLLDSRRRRFELPSSRLDDAHVRRRFRRFRPRHEGLSDGP